MYNTETIIKYVHYTFLGHSHFYFCFSLLIFFLKKGTLRGGLKHLSFYKVPYRVGWHAMGVVCKTVTPSQLMTNNTTPPEYMCIYTCINIYSHSDIWAHYVLEFHQNNHRTRAAHR